MGRLAVALAIPFSCYLYATGTGHRGVPSRYTDKVEVEGRYLQSRRNGDLSKRSDRSLYVRTKLTPPQVHQWGPRAGGPSA